MVSDPSLLNTRSRTSRASLFLQPPASWSLASLEPGWMGPPGWSTRSWLASTTKLPLPAGPHSKGGLPPAYSPTAVKKC